MKKIIVGTCLVLMTLAGCSTQNHQQNMQGMQDDTMTKKVNVEVKTNPEIIKSNEKTEIQAIVTQDGKAVDDAQSVKFEIWKEGDQKHDMLLAKHKGNGIYSLEKAFEQDGVYHIIAHTDARDMHVMPEVRVAVGNAKITQ